MPTVWDDTKVLHGRIGEFAAIARRSGEDWFIGCMNSGQDRTLELSLDFLEKGKAYRARVYSDDPTVATHSHVRIERRDVDSRSVIEAVLSARGGQAIWITPSL